jgi:hypothetical protein
MSVLRDPQSKLWRVNLKEEEKMVQKLECNHAHDISNQTELINYFHAACFIPVKSTWMQAIKNGNFTSWPGLTEQAVEKILSKSTGTVKGHINQQRMNTRSTHIKEEEDCKNEKETALDSGLKTHCVYAAAVDAGQIYTDQGCFPLVSSKGNKYIMVFMNMLEMPLWQNPLKTERQ